MFTTFINQFPYLGIFLLIMLGGVGFPFPEDATLILSGFLLAHEVIKPIPGFLVVYPSLLLTDYFLYYMGKKYGRKLVEHKMFHSIITPKRLTRIENRFKKHGIWIILIGRHIAGVRAQIFIVSGIMRISSIKFILADAFTVLFTIAIMAGAGYAGGNSLLILKKDMTKIGHFAILAVIFAILVYILYKNLKIDEPANGD
ncbi:MAG: hypothetical protein A3J83_03725 [Elusimicrobia bacterium RIFOXYA2_FULL_40_6]|nr:MAG: hypothetical protein A3J83_03725 [Elusimicrobia bacterium RIFOXYA2_FULL_40_6]